jgi:hypothetical protein
VRSERGGEEAVNGCILRLRCERLVGVCLRCAAAARARLGMRANTLTSSPPEVRLLSLSPSLPPLPPSLPLRAPHVVQEAASWTLPYVKTECNQSR